MALLDIRNLSKYYGDFRALNALNMQVQEGQIFGLLGPNGAGKTTLIRSINQIIAPDQGELLFQGQALKPRHISDIGYLPEERGLYPKMKVGEQLLYLARLKGLSRSEALKRIKYWLDRFELESWRFKTTEELSKGMAQKVQFIATVLHRPSLLIFDEPFSGFDPVNTVLIKEEIRRLRQEGATIIFSTHRMESVEEICDHIALIHQGEKILDGSVSEVREKFAENIYRFELIGDGELRFPAGFTLLEDDIQRGTRVLRLQRSDGDLALLVKGLAETTDIRAFREELPSLNDIFIKMVEKS